MKNDLALKSLQSIFERQIKGYDPRNSDSKLPNYKTAKFGKHSIEYFGNLGPMLWSKLG